MWGRPQDTVQMREEFQGRKMLFNERSATYSEDPMGKPFKDLRMVELPKFPPRSRSRSTFGQSILPIWEDHA